MSKWTDKADDEYEDYIRARTCEAEQVRFTAQSERLDWLEVEFKRTPISYYYPNT